MFTAADDTGCRRLQLEPQFKNKTQNATMWDGKEEEHTLKATEIFGNNSVLKTFFMDSLKLLSKSNSHLKCYRGNQVAKSGT